jgi:acid phosphatase (class A)
MIKNKLLFQINSAINTTNIDNIKYTTKIVEDKEVSQLINFDYKSILDNPPKNSSVSTLEELIYISKITHNRTDEDIEFVNKIDKNPAFLIIDFCNNKNIIFPKTDFNHLYKTIKPLILNTKYYFNRARPDQLAKFYGLTINIIETDSHHTPSYPSGHTVYARLAANLILESNPEFQYELDLIVNKSAHARVLQGVHYPSDNKASIIFTDYIFKRLINKNWRNL